MSSAEMYSKQFSKQAKKKAKHEFVCECGRDYVHLSDPEDNPEKYLKVIFECECGKQTELEFAVN
jgi:hypothetical protein